MTALSAALTLFLVMDPLGNVPLFIATLKGTPPQRRSRIIARELLIALAALLAALFFGRALLSCMKIDQPSLSVAGGIVLFLIAVKMIFPMKDDGFAQSPAGEPFIVPLAIPLIAGPSAISTVILMATREPDNMAKWFFAVSAAWVLNSAILLCSGPVSKLLGERGMIAVTRLMGMALTTVAVQMFMTGLSQFLGK